MSFYEFISEQCQNLSLQDCNRFTKLFRSRKADFSIDATMEKPEIMRRCNEMIPFLIQQIQHITAASACSREIMEGESKSSESSSTASSFGASRHTN